MKVENDKKYLNADQALAVEHILAILVWLF